MAGESMKVTNTCQGIPLYEFLRLEPGTLKAPFVMPVPFFNVLSGGVHSGTHNSVPGNHGCASGSCIHY